MLKTEKRIIHIDNNVEKSTSSSLIGSDTIALNRLREIDQMPRMRSFISCTACRLRRTSDAIVLCKACSPSRKFFFDCPKPSMEYHNDAVSDSLRRTKLSMEVVIALLLRVELAFPALLGDQMLRLRSALLHVPSHLIVRLLGLSKRR
jgi:hypothetical protein